MSTRFKAVTILVLSFSLVGSGQAQELQYDSPFKSFSSAVGSDVLHVFSSPLRLKPDGGLKLLALTALTTGFVTLLDSRIDENFIERDDFYVKPGIGLAKIGDVYDKISAPLVLAGLSVPMLAGGVILEDPYLLETTRLMIESFVISGIITQLGKRAFGRARPYTEEGPSKFAPFTLTAKTERRSFPSGHTATAFSLMTVLAKRYDPWWIKLPAYSVAVSVGLQRIDSRNHWGADVVVGGALGYWVASTLVNRYHGRPSKGLSINPYLFGTQVGILVGLD